MGVAYDPLLQRSGDEVVLYSAAAHKISPTEDFVQTSVYNDPVMHSNLKPNDPDSRIMSNAVMLRHHETVQNFRDELLGSTPNGSNGANGIKEPFVHSADHHDDEVGSLPEALLQFNERARVKSEPDDGLVSNSMQGNSRDDDGRENSEEEEEKSDDVTENESSDGEMILPVQEDGVPAVVLSGNAMVVANLLDEGRNSEHLTPHSMNGTPAPVTVANSGDKDPTNVNESDSESEDEEDEEKVEWDYPENNLSYDDLNYGIDIRDVGTSDSWVKRHPSLIRLTGRHPFNCEPPLTELMEHGFLTPTPIHYVRNHGYVPHGVWDEWTVEVSGLVKKPRKLSMNDLVTRFPQRENPVTLVCAGNRRMEQNLTSQTIGFNWGAAAISTSVWKGVRLCDVLRFCGVKSKKRGALHVCFEGAETLPGGGGSKYGTSITMEIALDEGRDVLLAYQQNGNVLAPDHGFPVRMIIPGYIGGRMVKWLTKIEVTEVESGNYYHYNDNRVLPSHVDAETAKAQGWWYKPDYIINELNINSAITTPAHNEVLPFDSTQKPYTVKGYAYSGGGRKVTRVELSLDAGATWRLCQVEYNETPTEHGKYWCWVFWQLDVDLTDFLQSKELVVRAWDAAMNTQPERLTWNVMGMMNNCWFRVKVEACKTRWGGVGLQFQHPTHPGTKPGGWMYTEKMGKSQGGLAPQKTSTLQRSPSTPSLGQRTLPEIPMSVVRRHTDSHSAWIVVHDVVYDCTPFLKEHPGGPDSILLTAGTDATEEFDAIHSDKAKSLLEKYKVGILASQFKDSSHSASSTPDNSLRGGNNFKYLSTVSEAITPLEALSSHPVALNPRERTAFHLLEKEVLSSNIRKLRFGLQSENHVLGLPTGKHVLVAGHVNGKLVMRAYTPTSNDKDVGYFDLIVKIYYKNDNFPAGGLMSQHLDSLKIGDSIEVKGPLGHIHYKGNGNFAIDRVTKFGRKFAMIAGGTGITPIYQVVRAILEDPEDKTDISLIYCNRSEEDIMLKDQLDEWQENHSNFRVWYTLTGRTRDDWAYSTGRISEQMMREHLPPGGAADTFGFVCGPPSLETTFYDALEKLGYQRQNCFSF